MKYFLTILAFLFSVNSFSQLKKADKFAKTITAEELKEHLYIYASDEFEGRNTGAEGQKKAVEYLRKFYIENEIEPGDPDKDYFQKMKLNLRRGNEGEVDSENVIAIIRGSEKPDEYLVLTAHLDHVGYGRTGSRSRDAFPGEVKERIHNGADDDGSGTVAMLEIAQAFKEASKKGKGPKRSIVFLHVTGEEKGLLGSAYYADNPIYPLANTVTNLNLDMIGRIDPTRKGDKREYIYIIGSDHDSQDLHALSEQTNLETVNIDLDYRYNAHGVNLLCEQYDLGRCRNWKSINDFYSFVKKRYDNVVVRKKVNPENIGVEEWKRQILQQLQNVKSAHVLNSTVSTELTVFGVPLVSHDKGDPCYSLRNMRFKRMKLLNYLAHCQWHYDEINNGKWWEKLKNKKGPKLYEI